MNAFTLVFIASAIGIAIILFTEMMEKSHTDFQKKDHDGLIIVKWSVVVMPLLVAALRVMPELAIASPVIFAGKIAITSLSRRITKRFA